MSGLLVVCALGIERFALRGLPRLPGAPGRADPRGPQCAPPGPQGVPGPDEAAPEPALGVLRTGMGPQAARRALAEALRDETVPGSTAVLATGFCAGLAPGMHPGDLVVAGSTQDENGRTPCTGTAALAEALVPYGTVHTGPLIGSGHVVRGQERAALREATGAVAVDMESAATLGTAVAGAPARPVAAVRVVVDAPGHELIRIGTLRGGISAFIVLRRVMPAFVEWHRSLLLPWR